MSNLSNRYNIKYKVREFSQNEIKKANKLKYFKKHYNIPSVIPSSVIDNIDTTLDNIKIETLRDTSFSKSQYTYDNTGWEICGTINYGLGTPTTWNTSISYDGSKTYDHRIEFPQGNYITETFGFPKIVILDSTHSPFEGSFAVAGDVLKFSGIVIGDEYFTYLIKVEYSDGTIDVFNYGLGTRGSITHLNISTFRNITGAATFTFEVTWENGLVQEKSANFTVVD